MGESMFDFSRPDATGQGLALPFIYLPPPGAKEGKGRFRETRKLWAARALFRNLAAFSPEMAAQLGFRIITRSIREEERGWQWALRGLARTSRIPYGAGAIAVYEWGSGPTVLMVHGWGARATHMGKMIMPLVESGKRVVAFDAPAHGESTGRYVDPMEFAGAVNAVASRVGAVDVLLAHSFGSATTMLARRDFGVAARRQIYIASFDHFLWFTEAFAQYLQIPHRVMDRMREIFSERYGGRFDWQQSSLVEMLRRHNEPTLLIHDQHDPEIPFQHAQSLQRAGEHVTLYATQHLGHHKLLGDPAVIERVVRFCAH